jgi:hypothetical protein
MFCRSLFVPLSLFFWSLCCLLFFDLRILITLLVSSNSSYSNLMYKFFYQLSSNNLQIILCDIAFTKYAQRTRRVLHVEQELLTSTKHPSSHPVFSGIRVARSIVFCVVLYRLLFVLFSLVIWPLYCLSFDLQLLINPLVSSNFSLSVLGEGFIA